jgi:hypothetical protein
MRLLTKESSARSARISEKQKKRYQKYIGVCLSGLILVTGRIVGPSGKAIAEKLAQVNNVRHHRD